MKITPFHPSHFGALHLDYRFKELVERVTPEYLAGLAAHPSITLWCNGIPIACGGVVGDCEAWAMFDAERSRRHKFAIVRAAKEFLRQFGYLYVKVDRPIDRKLPEKFLGFAQRGRQNHYTHLERVVR